jgi:predicted acetyltransferase
MTSFLIRRIEPDEFSSYVSVMFWAAGRPVDDEFIAERRKTFEIDRCFGAFEGRELVGTIGTRSLSMSLPGGQQVSIAAIGQGGVLPSHSRRGAMKQLMLAAIRDALDHREPLAASTSSQWMLYGRYGWGPSNYKAEYVIGNLARAALRDLDAPEGSVRMACSQEVCAALPPLHARASCMPGGVPRDSIYWSGVLHSMDAGRPLDPLATFGPLPQGLYCLRRDAAGVVDGCAIYRIHQLWHKGLFQSELEVAFFIAVTAEAALALWKFLLSVDTIESVRLAHRPLDEPLRWLLKDGRRLETVSIEDHIWLRILDPVEALRQRSFPSLSSPIRIKTYDPLQLAGKSTIEIISDGRETHVGYSDAAPEIEIDISTLSALLLNGNSVRTLAAARLVSFDSERSLIKLASAFAPIDNPFTDTSF